VERSGGEGRRKEAARHLFSCRLCPRSCAVDRRAGERGFCGAGLLPRVAAVSVHRGEEPPLSGKGGAGNIFFTGCNMACIFCQNYPVSRLGVGRDMTVSELAAAFLGLERKGVHNVNLVSPTPWVPQIVAAFDLAVARGFSLPVVYNTGGYERPETIALLAGVVDVYLPDIKYGRNAEAWHYSRAPRYVETATASIAAMHEQTGPFRTGGSGLARTGVLARHLVLPAGVSRTGEALGRLRCVSTDIPLSLMYQYFPAHRAVDHPRLGRRPYRDECHAALVAARGLGFEGWHQDDT
jgi:putative pyruvate formate lyase activating enzyme